MLSKDTASEGKALEYYCLATEVDDSDVALWNNLGTIAAKRGLWKAARESFEQGLFLDPHHPALQTKLLQLLLHIGDETGAGNVASAILAMQPGNILARNVLFNHSSELRLLQLPEMEQEEALVVGLDVVSVQEVTLEEPSMACLLKHVSQLIPHTAKLRFNVHSAMIEEHYPSPGPVEEELVIILEDPPIEGSAAIDTDDRTSQQQDAVDYRASRRNQQEGAVAENKFDKFNALKELFEKFRAPAAVGSSRSEEERCLAKFPPIIVDELEWLDWNRTYCMGDIAAEILANITTVSLSSVQDVLDVMQYFHRETPSLSQIDFLHLALVCCDIATNVKLECQKIDSKSSSGKKLGNIVKEAVPLGMLWLGRLRTEMELDNKGLASYWWARGRLYEVMPQVEDGIAAFYACSMALESVRGNKIILAKCQHDRVVDASSLSRKIEGLQLFGSLMKAEALIDDKQQVLTILLPIALQCNDREKSMAEMNRECWIKALKMLLQAAESEEQHVLGLRCHLRILEAHLPSLLYSLEELSTFKEQQEKELLSRFTSNPDNIEAMHSVAIYLDDNAREFANPSAALSKDALEAMEWDKVCFIAWNAFGIHYFAMRELASQADSLLSRGSLNSKLTMLRQVALDSALIAFHLRDMDPFVDHSPNVTFDVLYEITQCLGKAEALMGNDGAFVRSSLHTLWNMISQIDPQSEQFNEVNSAMQTCVYLLYGIRLPKVTPDWGNWREENEQDIKKAKVEAQLARMQSRSTCIELWHILHSFIEEAESGSLIAFKTYLEALGKHFPSPPREAVALADKGWMKMINTEPPQPGFEATLPREFNEAYECAGNAETVSREGAVIKDICSHLYYWRTLLQPEVEEYFKEYENVLEPVFETDLENLLCLCKADICYNPTRYEAWFMLSRSYFQGADLIVEEASSELASRIYTGQKSLVSRVEKMRKLGTWCAGIALTFARIDEERADVLYTLAFRLYAQTKNVPPAYNHLDGKPLEKDSLEYMTAAKAALDLLLSVLNFEQKDWRIELAIGFCLRKLGKPAEEYLPHMAYANYLAITQAGGLIDVFYALHASRLDLLNTNRAWSTTDALEMYCFSSDTQEKLDKASSVVSRLEILRNDCIAAMRWCLEKDKYFHKATWALSKAAMAQGDTNLAHLELTRLFGNAKHLFAVNIYQIAATAFEASKSKARSKGKHGRKTQLISVHSGKESEYGFPPMKPSGCGQQQSKSEFIGCLRKYLIQYLKLCGALCKLDILNAASNAYDWKGWPVSCDDLIEVATGQYVVTLLARLLEKCPAEKLLLLDEKNARESLVSYVVGQNIEEELYMAFKLSMDAGILSGEGTSWDKNVTHPAQQALKYVATQHAVDAQLRELIKCSRILFTKFGGLFCHLLAANRSFERLYGLLVPLRRPYKVLKQAPPAVRQSIRLICSKFAQALSNEWTEVKRLALECSPGSIERLNAPVASTLLQATPLTLESLNRLEITAQDIATQLANLNDEEVQKAYLSQCFELSPPGHRYKLAQLLACALSAADIPLLCTSVSDDIAKAIDHDWSNTYLPTCEESALQDRIAVAIRTAHLFIKQMPWLSQHPIATPNATTTASPRPPALTDVKAQVEESVVNLYRLYTALSGRQPPPTDAAAEIFKGVDNLIRQLRRQSRAAEEEGKAERAAERAAKRAKIHAQLTPPSALKYSRKRAESVPFTGNTECDVDIDVGAVMEGILSSM